MNASKIALFSLSFFAVPKQVYAANFGFVRFPDWMDQYFVLGLAVLAILFVLIMMTKPSGVPFSQLRLTKMRPLPTIVFRLFQICFFALMIMLFIGMGLERVAEA